MRDVWPGTGLGSLSSASGGRGVPICAEPTGKATDCGTLPQRNWQSTQAGHQCGHATAASQAAEISLRQSVSHFCNALLLPLQRS